LVSLLRTYLPLRDNLSVPFHDRPAVPRIFQFRNTHLLAYKNCLDQRRQLDAVELGMAEPMVTHFRCTKSSEILMPNLIGGPHARPRCRVTKEHLLVLCTPIILFHFFRWLILEGLLGGSDKWLNTFEMQTQTSQRVATSRSARSAVCSSCVPAEEG
jgi:hypothetical protein